MNRHAISQKYNDSWVFRLSFIALLNAVAMASTYALIGAEMPELVTAIVWLLLVFGLAGFGSWLVVPPLPPITKYKVPG